MQKNTIEVKFKFNVNDPADFGKKWVNETYKRTVRTSISESFVEYLFVLLPFIVIGVALALTGSFSRLWLLSEWPLASSILCAQAIFKLNAGSHRFRDMATVGGHAIGLLNTVLTFANLDLVENPLVNSEFRKNISRVTTIVQYHILFALFVCFISLILLTSQLLLDTVPNSVPLWNLALFVLSSTISIVSNILLRLADDWSARTEIMEKMTEHMAVSFTEGLALGTTKSEQQKDKQSEPDNNPENIHKENSKEAEH